MARRKTARTTRTTTKREPRATKSKKQATADVEVVEEKRGEGIETGIAVITAVALLAAILFTDALMGKYGSGLFFK